MFESPLSLSKIRNFSCFFSSTRFVTILPSIHLSAVISPEAAIKFHHPNEKLHRGNIVNWEEYLPGRKSSDLDSGQFTRYYMFEGESLLTVCLGLLSVFLTAYFMFMLYKCLCSRRWVTFFLSWLFSCIVLFVGHRIHCILCRGIKPTTQTLPK